MEQRASQSYQLKVRSTFGICKMKLIIKGKKLGEYSACFPGSPFSNCLKQLHLMKILAGCTGVQKH